MDYRPGSPKRYRPGIGLIGCGGITKWHLVAYRQAGYNVTALCDIDRPRAEQRRESTIPYPPPDECTPATWFGPQQRIVEDLETPDWQFSYYLFGGGISLGSQSGVFFTGENDVRWIHAETATAHDTRYAVTRVEPTPATGEIIERGESYTAPSYADPEHDILIEDGRVAPFSPDETTATLAGPPRRWPSSAIDTCIM